jgi:hypothetical protein
MKSLLYFNLPYSNIIEPGLVPNRVDSWKEDKDKDGNQSVPKSGANKEVQISQLIEVFEKLTSQQTTKVGRRDDTKIPNIILMEVEVESEGGEKTTNIIGGYSSDSWLITVGNEENLLGNDTCFLFNLTQNMRFNARKFNKQGGNSVGYISASEKKLRFGDSDLVINVRIFVFDNYLGILSKCDFTH